MTYRVNSQYTIIRFKIKFLIVSKSLKSIVRKQNPVAILIAIYVIRVQENELYNAIEISHCNFQVVWVTYRFRQIYKNVINHFW